MNPKSPKYTFKKAWSWPFEVEKKILELCEGSVLHVCSGDSKIGDVQVDLRKPKKYKQTSIQADPEKPSYIRASMFHLPIRPASFDTVLCDPPWELPYHVRGKVLRQLRDCIKPNGRLVFNSFWFPKTRGLAVDEQIHVGVPHNLWRNASMLITARRMALG